MHLTHGGQSVVMVLAAMVVRYVNLVPLNMIHVIPLVTVHEMVVRYAPPANRIVVHVLVIYYVEPICGEKCPDNYCDCCVPVLRGCNGGPVCFGVV